MSKPGTNRLARDVKGWASHPLSLALVCICLVLLFSSLPIGKIPFPDPEAAQHAAQAQPGVRVQYGDLIELIAVVATILYAALSLIPSLRTMADSSRFEHYAELDQMYLSLLTMAVERPELRQPDRKRRTIEQTVRYDTYAFMMWNFLETIRDRCVDDDRLKATWAPIIRSEGFLHGAWFGREAGPDANGNPPKFCLDFRNFVERMGLLEKEPDARQRAAWIAEGWPHDTSEKPGIRTASPRSWPDRCRAVVAANARRLRLPVRRPLPADLD